MIYDMDGSQMGNSESKYWKDWKDWRAHVRRREMGMEGVTEMGTFESKDEKNWN